jgi:hypothetical protein
MELYMTQNNMYPQSEYATDTSLVIEKENESPESIKEGLGFLLNRYIENHSQVVAHKIVQQLEKLLQHSDCIGFPNERCTYYRLLNYWRARCL